MHARGPARSRIPPHQHNKTATMRLALASACLLACVALATAASQPLSTLPAEARVMATHCLAEAGEDGCKWPCPANRVENCQLCQDKDDDGWVCQYCKAGYFKTSLYADEADWDSQCVVCPQGYWCAGTFKHACDNGVTTTGPGRWASSQCDQALPGRGAPGSLCTAGMFQPIISSAGTCSYCPDGFYANMNAGATECIANAGECPADSTLDLSIKSCKCAKGLAATSSDRKTVSSTAPIYPAPTCEPCNGASEATSVDKPSATGSTGCITCPANSRGQAVEGAKGHNVCICKAGYEPVTANAGGYATGGCKKKK